MTHHPFAGEYHLVQERRQECFIIASEPLSVNEEDRRDWVPVPKNHCVVITPQYNLLLYPIDVNGTKASTAPASPASRACSLHLNLATQVDFNDSRPCSAAE